MNPITRLAVSLQKRLNGQAYDNQRRNGASKNKYEHNQSRRRN